MSREDKPWRVEPKAADARWSSYMDRFQGMPTYYFESLSFPETSKEAQTVIQVLNSEIENIGVQLQELEIASTAKSSEDLASRQTKALRAQKMKTAQIRILEAWLSDQVIDVERELFLLKEDINSLKRAVRKVIAKIDIEEVEFEDISKSV